MADQKYLVGHTMGWSPYGTKERPLPVYVEVTYREGRLSLVGDIGNSSGGQISKPDFVSFAPGWDQESVDKLWEIWDRWHLNDMRAGCVHQRAEYDLHKKITVHKYTWTRAFHKMRRQAEMGEMEPEIYQDYQVYAKLVKDTTLGLNSPKYPTHPLVADALARGLIEEEKTEERIANWVDHREHPDGLLSKPCRECGYKYGTQWLFEQVPIEVIEWFNQRAKDTNAAQDKLTGLLSDMEEKLTDLVSEEDAEETD